MRQTTHENDSNKNKGFASMPKGQVKDIASKGGHASVESVGDEGMSERGSKGGHASAGRAGHEGMSERGSKGGHGSAENAGHEGMSARGRQGGQASGASKKGAYSDDEEEE